MVYVPTKVECRRKRIDARSKKAEKAAAHSNLTKTYSHESRTTSTLLSTTGVDINVPTQQKETDTIIGKEKVRRFSMDRMKPQNTALETSYQTCHVSAHSGKEHDVLHFFIVPRLS